MSKTLLELLYDGKLYPTEAIKPKDPEYSEINHKIAAERKHIMEILSVEDRERLINLDELYLHSATLYAYESFTYGFRLGVGLMVEVLADGNSFVLEEK